MKILLTELELNDFLKEKEALLKQQYTDLDFSHIVARFINRETVKLIYEGKVSGYILDTATFDRRMDGFAVDSLGLFNLLF